MSVTAVETVECPECAGEIHLSENVLAHEIIQCSDCGVELEFLSTSPVEVDLAPEIEEDWGE